MQQLVAGNGMGIPYSSRAILSMSQKQGFVKSMPRGALVMISEKSDGS